MGVHILNFGLVCLLLYLVGRLVWRRKDHLPPGPPGWPLIGNLFDVPMHAPYKAWGDMSRKYGPMIYLNLLRTQYVIINSPKVAKDLLEKKSIITSDRPRLTMGCDLVGLSNFTAFLPYSDTYRKHRKFFHQQIGTRSSLEAYYPAEEAGAKQFLRNVVQIPDDLIAHCHKMAGAIILKISHGYIVKEDGDPLLEIANKAVDNFSELLAPGRFLVDMLPILRYLPEWFPGGNFHKDARRWRSLLNEAVGTPYKFVLEQLAKGDAKPSFVSQTLRKGVTPEEEDILRWASFAMYIGGSDTTPAALHAFFLAMTLYPEILKKAQAEVDGIVGNDRLPICDDRDALPYINAICMELLRWHVVATFTIHVSTQDTLYEGYLIPKGTFLLPNIWFMLSDPETYPNPERFDPERFLGENQQMDPREVCFGWGRRACPGAHLAELTIFICIARAISTLNVLRHIEDGVEYVPRYEIIEGIVRHVKLFKCRIIPRSKKAEELLQG